MSLLEWKSATKLGYFKTLWPHNQCLC